MLLSLERLTIARATGQSYPFDFFRRPANLITDDPLVVPDRRLIANMIHYAILGTSHDLQDCQQFERPLIEAIEEYRINLVAEEYPFDIASVVSVVAGRLQIPYIQVDLFPGEWAGYGIDWEMKARMDVACLVNEDVRLSNADRVREEIWLERIEEKLEHGRVLIVCGYLHVSFLAESIQNRGAILLGQRGYPANLLRRTPEKTFSPTELRDCLKGLVQP